MYQLAPGARLRGHLHFCCTVGIAWFPDSDHGLGDRKVVVLDFVYRLRGGVRSDELLGLFLPLFVGRNDLAAQDVGFGFGRLVQVLIARHALGGFHAGIDHARAGYLVGNFLQRIYELRVLLFSGGADLGCVGRVVDDRTGRLCRHGLLSWARGFSGSCGTLGLPIPLRLRRRAEGGVSYISPHAGEALQCLRIGVRIDVGMKFGDGLLVRRSAALRWHRREDQHPQT